MGPRGTRTLAAAALAAAAAALPAPASAHPERPSFYPEAGQGAFPEHRSTGRARVVCKPDSRRRIVKQVKNRKLRARNLKLLKSCRYAHIQQAVNAARSGDRIQILPGVYREEPSRAAPNPDPRCKDMYVLAASGSRQTQTYEYEVNCPYSRQLIAILGDSLADADRRCDSKCNLQVEGTGDDRGDVLIVGDRRKENVIKADRADGIYLANFTIQYSDYNNIYVLETDGFRFRNIVSRWSEEYGFLSFASDHGIYEHLEAYGSGDSGVYPGSGPETHGSRYGIKLRYNDIHDNLQGNAGAAGNGLWFHKNRFHHNGIGIVVDSFSAGHPGMPQDSSKFTQNRIYSNNRDYFTPERDEYCKKPVLERDPKVVCPAIMVPIGTGILIAGGNENITADNRIWDNWRYGVMQIWVEASFRGENEPEKQADTSNGNRYLGNHMGSDPAGARAPNGTDFFWDEQGAGNCWMGNVGIGDGGSVSGNPSALPECPGSEVKRPVNPAKHAFLVPCATWDPYENTDPPGCDWMTLPPKPE